MKKLKYAIISTIIIFSLMFITHNLYDWLPNFLTSIFFPVNESTMEHMKMISSTYLIYNIGLYFIKKDKYNNFILNYFVSTVFNIILFLLIYIPLYYNFGDIMIVTFILLFITILITSFISYKILTNENNKSLNIISLILSILIIVLFTIFTYFPPNNPLFIDKTTATYGLD